MSVSPSAPRAAPVGVDARPARGTPTPVRARAVLLTVVLMIATVFYLVWGVYLGAPEGLGMMANGALDSLFGYSVALLCLLVAGNTVLRRARPRWAFHPGELLVVYLASIVGVGVAASVWCWGGDFPVSMAYPAWAADTKSRWAETVGPYLPAGLTVTDRGVLAGFFLGGSSPSRAAVLRAWAAPTFWWTAWVTATLWVVLCLSVLVRRRWTEEERLPYPLTVLPLQLVDAEAGLLRNRLWWLGVGLAALVGVSDVLHGLCPQLPALPTWVYTGGWQEAHPPWDAVHAFTLQWGPWQFGLAYLIPLEMAFSLLVFNAFWKAEFIFSKTQGWMTSLWSGFPYGELQTLGCYLALLAVVVWLDRRYLAHVLRRALARRGVTREVGEALSYRTALLGAAGGLAFLGWFYVRGGLALPVTAVFLFLQFAVFMMIVRLRAHVGPPGHNMPGIMPQDLLAQFPGPKALGPRALATIALVRPFLDEHNSNPAPAQLEGLYLAGRTGTSSRRLALTVLAMVPLVMVCYFAANLYFGYHWGVAARGDYRLTWVARQVAEELDSSLRDPAEGNWSGVEAVGVGAVATVALMWLKLRFPGFPLHPVAFPLSFNWNIDCMLVAIAVTWVLKSLLLRYGGLRAHRTALPFFLGLLAGSATTGLLGGIVTRVVQLRA